MSREYSIAFWTLTDQSYFKTSITSFRGDESSLRWGNRVLVPFHSYRSTNSILEIMSPYVEGCGYRIHTKKLLLTDISPFSCDLISRIGIWRDLISTERTQSNVSTT